MDRKGGGWVGRMEVWWKSWRVGRNDEFRLGRKARGWVGMMEVG